MRTRVDFCAEVENEMRLQLPSKSVNESMARAAVAAFCAQLNPTAVELADIKCAVSEAVTNAIVHGYRDACGEITLIMKIGEDRIFCAEVRDKGCGIADIDEAMRPLFTTDPEGERGGMGFSIMESFTDDLTVRSFIGKGTTVIMEKKFRE